MVGSSDTFIGESFQLFRFEVIGERALGFCELENTNEQEFPTIPI